MQARAPQSNHGVLRCPVCRTNLRPRGRSLTCEAGHSFDLARSGYVNLAIGRRRPPAGGGDTRQQLDRRHTFLAGGHFDFIAEAIACHAHARLPGRPLTVLDAGCGTGHHLAEVVKRIALRRNLVPTGVGLDLSKDAAGCSARKHPTMTFAVADIWAEWPVHSASVDLVVSVFAPKNFAEMARVLRPGGLLAMAFPGETHLVELRRDFRLMGLRPGKAEIYAERLRSLLGSPVRRRLRRGIELDRNDVTNLVMMGPNARHPVDGTGDADEGRRPVSFDVELVFSGKPTND